MMGIFEKGLGDDFKQFFLHRAHRFARGKTRAVGDAKDVGIDGDGRVSKGRIENHIRRLATNAREGFEGLSGCRHLPIMVLQQLPAQADDVFGLGFIQAECLDVLHQAFLTEGKDGFRGVGYWKEPSGCLIHALVGSLSRKDDGNQQLKRRGIVEFCGWMWIKGRKASEKQTSRSGIHESIIKLDEPLQRYAGA